MQKRRIIITITSLPKVIWEEGRVAALSHVRRKVPIGYNGAAQIRPQKYPFPWTDPQTPPPASSLHPSDQWCQTAAGSDPPFFHNALDRPTDERTYARTYVRTDRLSTGKFDDYIGRYSPRATGLIIKRRKIKVITIFYCMDDCFRPPPSICAFVRQSNPSGT